MSDISSAKKVKRDQYSNVAFQRLTLSAANTLTFEPIAFAVGIFQGIGLLLNRILYTPNNATLREIVAATDHLDMGITTSNRLAGLDPGTDPAVIDVHRITGIAAGIERFNLPIIHDFTGLPGGGKLCSANPLYVGGETGGFVAAAMIDVQLEFQFVQLRPEEYLELIQAQFPANIV